MITVGIHIPPGSDRRSKQPPVSTILLTDLFKPWTSFEPTDPALQVSLEEEMVKYISEVRETKEADVVVGTEESGYMSQSKVPQAHWTSSLAHSHHAKGSTDEVVEKGQSVGLVEGGVDPSFVALDSHFIEDIQREWSESEDAWEEVAGTATTAVADTADVAQVLASVAEASASAEGTRAAEAKASDALDSLKKTAVVDDITSKFGHSTASTEYKKLALLPRSADLPPPLPPMQQVKKAPVVTKPASSHRKLKSNKQAVPTGEKKSHFGLLDEGDSDSDSDNSSKSEDPATSGSNASTTSGLAPTTTTNTTTAAINSTQIALDRGHCGHNLELYTYKCPICTLDNVIHEASVGGEVRCEACDTPHIIPTLRTD